MTKSLVEQFVSDPQHMREYQQERAIYQVTELLESVMEEQGISRAQLARMLGKSKPWVTQLLDGEQNKTIRTLADVFAVLGREYCSFQRPIQIGRHANGVERAARSDGDGPNTIPIFQPGGFQARVVTESSDEVPQSAAN